MKKVSIIKFLKENEIKTIEEVKEILMTLDIKEKDCESKSMMYSGVISEKYDDLSFFLYDICMELEEIESNYNEANNKFSKKDIDDLHKIKTKILDYQDEYGGLYREYLYL